MCLSTKLSSLLVETKLYKNTKATGSYRGLIACICFLCQRLDKNRQKCQKTMERALWDLLLEWVI